MTIVRALNIKANAQLSFSMRCVQIKPNEQTDIIGSQVPNASPRVCCLNATASGIILQSASTLSSSYSGRACSAKARLKNPKLRVTLRRSERLAKLRQTVHNIVSNTRRVIKKTRDSEIASKDLDG